MSTAFDRSGSGRTIEVVRWVRMSEFRKGRLGALDGLRRAALEARRLHPSVKGSELADVRLLRRGRRVRLTFLFVEKN